MDAESIFDGLEKAANSIKKPVFIIVITEEDAFSVANEAMINLEDRRAHYIAGSIALYKLLDIVED